MLHKLRIEHLVLVDFCEISLTKGFHVITGETGAGKSILLTAIGLLLGEKADASAIRHGEKMAVIEGEFHLPCSSQKILLDAEIDIEGPTCTIRREIHHTGKTRAFIDGHLVPVNLLKQLGSTLVEISDQHACLSLTLKETPRQLLDTYGDLEETVGHLRQKFDLFHVLTKKKELLQSLEPSRSAEIEHLQSQIDEISGSEILHTDDNALFLRLSELSHSQEAFDLASLMLSEIESGKNPLQSTLFRLSQRAEKLASLHTSCRPIADLLNSSLSSTREAGNDLQRELSSFDHSEEESERIEATLRRIDAIKRKYGSSTEEVLLAKTSMEEKLHLLLGRDNEIAQLEESLVTTKAACDSLAKELTSKRTETARRFGRIIECHLQSLNMPNALLNISVTPAPRSSTGDDHIQLVCSPNVGEKTIDVSEGASGGELARIYLAIQAVLADRFIIPTVLFDEIDASIGGMTANAVGDTLAAIGERRQVLSVTHFVQVASKAHSHFALTKEVRDGRTITLIQELTTKESKKREHQRMVGTHRS